MYVYIYIYVFIYFYIYIYKYMATFQRSEGFLPLVGRGPTFDGTASGGLVAGGGAKRRRLPRVLGIKGLTKIF